MKKLCTIIISLIYSLAISAQDTAIVEQKQITFRWSRYKLDGEKLSNKELKNELMKYESSAKEYKNYKTWKTTAWVTGIATVVAYLVTPNSSSRTYDNRKIGGKIAIFTLSTTYLISLILTEEHKRKSARLYNKEVTMY